jgi:hypothetical protein
MQGLATWDTYNIHCVACDSLLFMKAKFKPEMGTNHCTARSPKK